MWNPQTVQAVTQMWVLPLKVCRQRNISSTVISVGELIKRMPQDLNKGDIWQVTEGQDHFRCLPGFKRSCTSESESLRQTPLRWSCVTWLLACAVLTEHVNFMFTSTSRTTSICAARQTRCDTSFLGRKPKRSGKVSFMHKAKTQTRCQSIRSEFVDLLFWIKCLPDVMGMSYCWRILGGKCA